MKHIILENGERTLLMLKYSDVSVELLDCMGNDLTVVNAARVSFAKQSAVFSEKDEALIAYLARNGHWTPFAHPHLSFRIKAPIFVARQLARHQVGLVWNEVSRRYVDAPPEFYLPVWRKRAEDVKQGSGEEFEDARGLSQLLHNLYDLALFTYQELLDRGVCPEQARIALPVGVMTEWVWTGSLYAFARVCSLRLDVHAQKETRLVAEKIADHLRQRFPVSSRYLLGACE